MERRQVYYNVLPYPIVQYITLRQRVIFTNNLVAMRLRTDIRVAQNYEELNNILRLYNIKEFNYQINWENNIAVVSTNYLIEDTKYRTNLIYSFGIEKPGAIQISTFTKNLFYRNQIYFLCYTWDGKKINIPRRVYNIRTNKM